MASYASSSNALGQLEKMRNEFRKGVSAKKLALLNRLERIPLMDNEEVERLHNLLMFMRAYPDDSRLMKCVDRMLDGFADREDLQELKSALVNSGIAGTEVHFSFYWFTLCRLAERWPDRLQIDWKAFRGRNKTLLDRRLAMLMPYGESLALEEAANFLPDWIDTLRGPDETQSEFLVRRFEALPVNDFQREAIFEEMDVPFRLLPGPDTPSNTANRVQGSPIVYQRRQPEGSRSSFSRELNRPEIRPRTATSKEAKRLLELALGLMVARTRDLDCFVHGDPKDVRVVDYPEGFQLVCIGTRPERRQVLDAAYGFLMLRNGMLIGYVLSASLFGSSEVAYNVSPQFRGAEAAHPYARCLHAVKYLFGADTFMVDPYQMGHENLEGLKSGAWWFYYKLGFRPRDPKIAKMAAAELERAQGRKGYRSSLAKLNRLSSVNMYLNLGEPRDQIIGEFNRGNVGLHLVRYLAERFGSNRERGLKRCSAEAAERLGLDRKQMSEGESLALERWAPLVSILPGIDEWSDRELKALGQVVRAKGGRRESDFIRRFDRHRKLRGAVFELARSEPISS